MPTAPHSPAPWTAHGTRVSAADGSDVCDVCPPQPNDGQTFEANRHLITAAPDMLEALRAIQSLPSHRQDEAPLIAQNAIDKAEGR